MYSPAFEPQASNTIMEIPPMPSESFGPMQGNILQDMVDLQRAQNDFLAQFLSMSLAQRSGSPESCSVGGVCILHM